MATDTVFAAYLPAVLCDFCGQDAFVKIYACRSFVSMKGTPQEYTSGQEWMACAQCAKLIDGESWISLQERAVQAFVTQRRLPLTEIPAVREHLSSVHTAFRQYMIRES